MASVVYLGLGTNLGNKEDNIRQAIQKIKERMGEVIASSALHEYTPWGFESINNFINAVVAVETDKTPLKVLSLTQEIEQELGRTKKSVNNDYKDRIIDIDILLFDDMLINTKELTVPHPLMTERIFVLEPLCEIAPDYVHPIRHKTIKELLISIQHRVS
jgi:2-amino-4-hydroxy-6-hydroxymethyldihydropteridine diphosphokinase